MSFVVDASMVAAWVLPDEQAEPTDAIMFRLEAEHARAPSLFWQEAASTRRSVRVHAAPLASPDRGCRSRQRRCHFCARDQTWALHLRRTYLALAVVDQSSLATLDEKLAAAARAEGLLVIGPLSG